MRNFEKAFGQAACTARCQLALTQERVADLAGISTRWYQQIESGSRTPSSRLLLRLCVILQIDTRLLCELLPEPGGGKNGTSV